MCCEVTKNLSNSPDKKAKYFSLKQSSLRAIIEKS